MSKHLSKERICELAEGLDEILTCYENIRNKNESLLKAIHWPSTPGILGESIIYHLINDEKILSDLEIVSMKLLNKKEFPDLQVRLKNGKEIGVQVKNTRKNGGVRLSENDVRHEYLIWLDFGEFFPGKKDVKINICILKNPEPIIRELEEEARKENPDKKIIGATMHFPLFRRIARRQNRENCITRKPKQIWCKK
ncbi:MAG: hypothetical protein ACXADD_14185 [Candidatus Thorarchaeota archaeon]|jgi:hypothetical protein